MKKFIIGTLILLIAIPFFAFNFVSFLNIVGRLLPVLMIVGGAFGVYYGIKELKQLKDNDDALTMIEPYETQPSKAKEENTGSSQADIQMKPGTIAPEIITEEKSTDTPDEQPAASPPQEAQTDDSSPQQSAEPIVTEEIVTQKATPAETKVPDAQVQFKGNIETLVFHSVACNFASGKNCSMDFANKKEAESQGYKPCKICMAEA